MARTTPVPISRMLNLGPRSAEWLATLGIASGDSLRRVGAVAAFVKLKRTQSAASLNLLYALVGALEDVHWTRIRRSRRLELSLAVEDYERRHRLRSRRPHDGLTALRNIGPAMRRDLGLLGISTVAQLAKRQPDALFRALERRTGRRQDPCVWDTFAAAIHQARTGEALPWWHFTVERKRRQSAGLFERPGTLRVRP